MLLWSALSDSCLGSCLIRLNATADNFLGILSYFLIKTDLAMVLSLMSSIMTISQVESNPLPSKTVKIESDNVLKCGYFDIWHTALLFSVKPLGNLSKKALTNLKSCWEL